MTDTNRDAITAAADHDTADIHRRAAYYTALGEAGLTYGDNHTYANDRLGPGVWPKTVDPRGHFQIVGTNQRAITIGDLGGCIEFGGVDITDPDTLIEAARRINILASRLRARRPPMADADTTRATNRLIAAALAHASALALLMQCPNRQNRQAVGNTEDALMEAAEIYRNTRTDIDAERDRFLADYPTPAAMQAAVDAYRQRLTPPTLD